jgi:aspartate racemase
LGESLNKKKIGILSGMGAAAGARFYSVLVEECQRLGAKCDSDFPEVVLYNVSSKGMDETGVCDESTLKVDLLAALKHLDACGCELIIMACNTIHIYLRLLQHHTKAEILNMVDLTQQSAMANSVGVVCSRTSRDRGLYLGIQVTDEQQDEVDAMIGRVIAGYSGTAIHARDKMTLMGIIDSLFERGAQRVIIGCTELPLITERRTGTIDPAEIVIRRALTL